MTSWDFKQELVNQVILDSLVNPKANSLLDKELEEMMVKMKQMLIIPLPFMSFVNCFRKKRGHTTLAGMLEPNFKNMHLVRSYMGWQEGNNFGC